MSNPGEIKFLQEEISEQNRALRETRIRNMRDMEGLQKSHVLKVEELSRRKLTEDQNTIMELRARIQELQNESNCMNDSRVFKDAESIRSGLSHVPSQTALLPPHRDPRGLLSRNNQPPDIRNSQGISGNVFANPRASSSSPYPGGFNPWVSNVTEDAPVLTSTGGPLHVVNVRFHSLNSEIAARTVSRKFIRPLEGRFFKELWSRPTTTADLRSSL